MKKAVCLLLVMLLIMATCACAAKGPASVTPNSEESQSTSKEDTGSTDVPDESQENAVTVADPFGKFEPAIDITTMMLEDNIRNVPDNMTMESNPWIDLFKEYGINVTYKISGSASDLDTKLNMAIATDDLPDIMQVSATQFQELSEAGYLADLTEVFEAYATPETKAMFMQDGGIMMGNGYVNGKLVGLVMPQGYQDFIPIVSIRSDWLEECGLSAPQTMDELWNIAKTFKEKNMGGTCTIGIGMTKNVLDLLTPTIGLLNGYHAYYNIWMEQGGELVNSTIQPEMKQALAALSEKYAEGLIDPEFGTKENAQLMEDVMAGRCGVVVSHFCAPFDLLNAVADGQEWSYYAVPSADSEPVLGQFNLAFSGALCVSAKCAHPEAMIEMLNLFTKYVAEDPQTYNDNAVRNFAYPTITASISGNTDIHKEYLEFLETGVTPAATTQGYESTVEAAEKYRLNQDIDGYTMWAVFGPEGTQVQVAKAIETNAYMIDVYTGAPTEGMSQYGSTLKSMTEQIVTDIIRGVKPVDAFDEFVASWKANGGDIIAEEVNAWYRAQTVK